MQAGDSVTSGNLVSVIPRAIRLNRPRPDPFPSYAAQLEAIAEAAPEFDILHCNTDWIHLPLIGRLGIPHLTTFHHRLDIPDLPPVALRFPDAPLISISDYHRAGLPSANWLGTVYHGMPADTLKPSYERGIYLVFLERLTKEKGPEAAIRIARATGLELRMAAKVPWAQTRYKDRLQPLVDGKQIKLSASSTTARKAICSGALQCRSSQ